MENELENHKKQISSSKEGIARKGKLFLFEFLDLFEI